MLPDVPLTVRRCPSAFPLQAECTVSFEVVRVEAGLNWGSPTPVPDADSCTKEVNPKSGVTVMVVVPEQLPPAPVTRTTTGSAEREKSGGGGLPPTTNVKGWICEETF